jgi:predicted DNA-binding protein
MSAKFQITLPEDLAEELKGTSMQLRIPLAQFIRETMEERLREMRSRRGDANPFASITGIIDSGQTDLAATADEIYD